MTIMMGNFYMVTFMGEWGYVYIYVLYDNWSIRKYLGGSQDKDINNSQLWLHFKCSVDISYNVCIFVWYRSGTRLWLEHQHQRSYTGSWQNGIMEGFGEMRCTHNKSLYGKLLFSIMYNIVTETIVFILDGGI